MAMQHRQRSLRLRALTAPAASALIVLISLLLAAPAAWASGVPAASVTGPIPVNAAPGDPSHDYVFFTPQEDLSEFGYVEEEFFVEGLANRYDTTSGGTATIVSSGHPYKTRIVVRRPQSRDRSNGIVLFEWQNVSAGYELDAHWAPSWRHFVRRGYTWVGVSAQRVGVHGFGIPGLDNGLKDWSPLRYGSLDVTAGGTVLDDSLSYDIFAQAAQAALSPQGPVKPLANLRVKQALAIGASQSAGRLTVYHNSIHPLHELFDGFYLLVGGGPLRTDLDVKVLRYLSETDVGRAGPGIRQDDSDVLVTHEVAGTAHSSFISNVYREPITLREFGSLPFPASCDLPPYSRVPGYHVINKNYDQLSAWVGLGVEPPASPRLVFDETVDPPVLARDAFGIAEGGIRLAAVETPIALNSGQNSGSVFCVLFGTHQPFDDATLQTLYPTSSDYIAGVFSAVLDNLLDGYIGLVNAFETLIDAAQAGVPPQ